MLTNTNENAVCKTCEQELIGHISLKEGEEPNNRALIICPYCATVSKFNKKLRLKPLSQKELNKIEKEEPPTWGAIVRSQKFILRRYEQSRHPLKGN